MFVVPADQLVPGTVVVDGPEGRHAAMVTRLRVGEPVVLTDGAGRRGEGVVAVVGKDRVEVDLPAVAELPPSVPRLVVVQALPKGDRGELAIELMTEVGVDVVVPWAASRCITRWRDVRGEKALSRWRTSAQTAAKQSRRARFPEIAAVAGTPEVEALLSGAALGAVLHEEATEPLAAVRVPADGDVVLVVGPEGGVSPEELAAFTHAGAGTYRLGDTVLRTSTAGAAGLAVLLSRTRWR